MTQYGIVVDLERCVGCMTCVVNCKAENLTRPGVWWNQILQVEDADSGRIIYVRYACMHCENPPCVKACPNHAIYRRSDGVVIVDKGTCAGATACIKACPYGVIALNPDTEYFEGQRGPGEANLPAYRIHPPGKASICTLCYHRLDEGLSPACVVGCPSKAMIFGDLDDPESAVSVYMRRKRSEAMHASAGSAPKVTYVFPPGLKDSVERQVGADPRMVKA